MFISVCIYTELLSRHWFRLYDGLRTMERRGKQKIDRLFVSGGGSISERYAKLRLICSGYQLVEFRRMRLTGNWSVNGGIHRT